MKKNEILKSAKEQKDKFSKISNRIPYELRGVLASEALFITAITKTLGVEFLIESGRARGYSTKLFAEVFKDNSDFKIVSIDKDKYSKDVQYSENHLSNYGNVSLEYGDTKKVITKFLNKKCVVFIDGPKGDEALLLAADLIKNEKVKAVFVHDLHQNTFHRNICEMIFNNTFFSDDEDFVERFVDLDAECWKVLEDHGEAPYVRKGKRIDSYASTVGVIFNGSNSIEKDILSNYKRYYKGVNDFEFKQLILPIIPTKVKSFIKRILNK